MDAPDTRPATRTVRFVADPWPWRRQFPTATDTWNGVRFVFDDDDGEVDAVVVYGLPRTTLRLRVPRERAVFVAPEPVTVHRYHDEFLSQFGVVITTDPQTRHEARVLHQVGLPWHVGVWADDGSLREDDPLTLDDFLELRPLKTRLASVVSSDKSFTREHRLRLEFVRLLKAEFGGEIDVYGRGVNDFVDKFDVLAPYRYHIAIENCSYPHFWSEKIADPFLTLTYPIYHGAPNLHEYVPAGSFTSIDIARPEQAVSTIRSVLHSDKDREALAELERARRAVLFEHNLFAVLAHLVTELPLGDGRPRSLSVHPEARWLPGRRRAAAVRSLKAGLRRLLPDRAQSYLQHRRERERSSS